jgi:fructose-bisphosphate aldolase class II
MSALREVLAEAGRRRVAVGHFNFSELVVLKAAAEAAGELGVPVVMGVSESEREFLGVRQAAALVQSIREEKGRELFLNADHTHSIAKAEEAARAGFDMIVFDASEKRLEENIAETRRAAEAVKSIRPSILVEGEVGYVGSGSEIHEKRPDNIRLTEPEEAREFVAGTKVDLLSPSVGTTHGMLRSMIRGTERKRLDIQRIAAIKKIAGIPLTLHGGSGTDNQDFREAIKAGISMIHINTELRVAWRRGLAEALGRDAGSVAPYKVLPDVVREVKAVVVERLRLFNGN